MSAAGHPVHPDLTVIIPTVGRPVLAACLNALGQGTTWPARVIVVDQSANSAMARQVDLLRDRGLDAVHVPPGRRAPQPRATAGWSAPRPRSWRPSTTTAASLPTGPTG